MGRIPKSEKIKAIQSQNSDENNNSENPSKTELLNNEYNQNSNTNNNDQSEDIDNQSDDSYSDDGISLSESCASNSPTTSVNNCVIKEIVVDSAMQGTKSSYQLAQCESSSSFTSFTSRIPSKIRKNYFEEDFMSKFLKVVTSSDRTAYEEKLKNSNRIMKRITIGENSNGFSYKNLLQMHKPLMASSMTADTRISDFFVNSSLLTYDPSYHIISALLNDKLYQLYNEYNKPVMFYLEKAKKNIEKGVTVFEGHDFSLKKYGIAS